MSGGDDEAAAPTLEEKLQRPLATGGKARCRLSHFAARWGVGEYDPKKPPETLFVKRADLLEVWTRCGPAKGLDTTYELQP